MSISVRALFVAPEKKSTPIAVSSVDAVPTGFDGDYHSRLSTRRAVLMISGSVLDELDIAPGAVFENMVLDGLDVMSLQAGQQVRIGNAVFEVTVPCEPCVQMDRVRDGLRDALIDRRGMFVKVVTPGSVRVGDPVEVV